MTKSSAAIKGTGHSTNAHSEEITGFVPTQDELIHLVKHWVRSNRRRISHLLGSRYLDAHHTLNSAQSEASERLEVRNL